MRLMRTCVATITLLAVVGFAGTAYAQGPNDNNGNPTILQAVQNLQSTLNALSASTSLGNTRFTPSAFVLAPDMVSCEAVNVSAATQTVRVQLINGIGTLIGDTGNSSTAAGVTFGLAQAGSGLVYCKITVVGGSRTDIRGSLGFFTLGSSQKLVLPAE